MYTLLKPFLEENLGLPLGTGSPCTVIWYVYGSASSRREYILGGITSCVCVVDPIVDLHVFFCLPGRR